MFRYDSGSFTPTRLDAILFPMNMKLELVPVPVTDVDRAIEFYTGIGFALDHDIRVSATARFVQLTPPGSACSIMLGTEVTEMKPGSQQGLLVVVDNADEARARLVSAGIEATEVRDEGWGRFTYFEDPDGNSWAVQELPQTNG